MIRVYVMGQRYTGKGTTLNERLCYQGGGGANYFF